jgi:hypothetical protein
MPRSALALASGWPRRWNRPRSWPRSSRTWVLRDQQELGKKRLCELIEEGLKSGAGHTLTPKACRRAEEARPGRTALKPAKRRHRAIMGIRANEGTVSSVDKAALDDAGSWPAV